MLRFKISSKWKPTIVPIVALVCAFALISLRFINESWTVNPLFILTPAFLSLFLFIYLIAGRTQSSATSLEAKLRGQDKIVDDISANALRHSHSNLRALPDSQATPETRQSSQKRKASASFAKLQALSASGVGSKKLDQELGRGATVEDLHSILGRLEDAKSAAIRAASPAPNATNAQEVDAGPAADDDNAVPLSALLDAIETPISMRTTHNDDVLSQTNKNLTASNFAESRPDAQAQVADDSCGSPTVNTAQESLLDDFGNSPAHAAQEAHVSVAESQAADAVQSAAVSLGSDNVFGSAIDKDIDDLFSRLVPVEAQKEVTSSRSAAANFLQPQPEAPLDLSDKEIMVPDEVQWTVQPQPQSETATGLNDKEIVATNKMQWPQRSEAVVETVLDRSDEEIVTPNMMQMPQKHQETQANKEQFGEISSVEGEATSGLFDRQLGKDLDDIFANLVPPEAQLTVNSKSLNLSSTSQIELKEPELQREEMSFAPPLAAEPRPKALADFKPDETTKPAPTTADKVLDLLENLADKITTPPNNAPPVADSVSIAKTDALDSAVQPGVQEFGRLSIRSAEAANLSPVAGTMKAIGKLLVDSDAIESIIKSGESGDLGKNLVNAKVISSTEGEGLKNILQKIETYPGVAGNIFVGYDGLVIVATTAPDKDKETIGALAVALLGSSNHGAAVLEIGKLRQLVLISDKTITVLTDVDIGILVILIDRVELSQLDGLLELIETVVYS